MCSNSSQARPREAQTEVHERIRSIIDRLPLATILAKDGYHAIVAAVTSSELRFGTRSADDTDDSLKVGNSDEFGWRVVHIRCRWDRKRGRSQVKG